MPLLDEDAKLGLRTFLAGDGGLDPGSGYPDGIQRARFTEGSRTPYNRKTSSYDPTGPVIRCRIRPLTKRELEALGAAQLPIGTNSMAVPLGTDLSGLDHVIQVIEDDLPLDPPLTYDVVGDPSRRTLELAVQLRLTTNIKE